MYGVSQTKFLGVIIDDKLNWKPHILSLYKKLLDESTVLRNACQNHYISKYIILFLNRTQVMLFLSGEVFPIISYNRYLLLKRSVSGFSLETLKLMQTNSRHVQERDQLILNIQDLNSMVKGPLNLYLQNTNYLLQKTCTDTVV